MRLLGQEMRIQKLLSGSNSARKASSFNTNSKDGALVAVGRFSFCDFDQMFSV